MAGDIWSTVHAERKALAADLDGITDAQWRQTTLCTEWTVWDVLAHMTATAKIGPGQFLGKMLASGFSLSRVQAKDIQVERGSSPADTLSRFKAIVDFSKHPPGPTDTWLGEVIIHGEDIRRALDIKHDYPTDAVVRVADFYKGSNLVIGAKKRIAGLTLKATDASWTTGTGAEVTGPVLSLMMAMTGRKAAIDDLAGEGVETLRSRS